MHSIISKNKPFFLPANLTLIAQPIMIVIILLLSYYCQEWLPYYSDEGDLLIYYTNYEYAKAFSLSEYLEELNHEPLYLIYSWICSNLSIHFLDFLAINRALLSMTFLTCANWALGKNFYSFLATIVIVVSPFFMAYSSVAVRQGLAFIFFLPFLSNYSDRKYKKSILFALAAISTHLSTIIFLPIGIITRFKGIIFNTIMAFSSIFILSLYILDVTQSLFPDISVYFEKLEAYGSHYTGNYQTGFKFTFFIVSSFQLLISYTILFIKKVDLYRLRVLSKFCILLIAVYMLLSGMAFYDRVAALSFMLFPIQIFGFIQAIFKDRIEHSS